MRPMTTGRRFLGFIAAAIVLFTTSANSAYAQDGGTLIADGLNGPMGVLVTPDGTVWVVDSGTGGDEVREGIDPATRQPSTIRTGETSRILSIHSDGTQEVIALLPSVMTNPTLVFGGARLAMLRGKLYVTSGGWSEVNPGERESLHAAVVRIADGERTEVANTWNVELDSNPDGMSRESNPYGLTVGPDSMLWVADAAANTLLKVDPATGALVVVAVFDGIESPLPSPNRGGALESDPVPTAVAFDEEGNAYVSLLSGIPFRIGAAEVVKVTPHGAVEDWATNLTMLTDLRRGPDGHLYAVSYQEITEQGPVPNSGAIVRVHPGSASEEVVTGLSFPTSVDFNADGDAFVTTNGGGPPGAGELRKFEGMATPRHEQADIFIAAGLTVDADGNTIVPVEAEPHTLLYYRRTRLPVLAPDGHPVTAGEYATAKGTAEVTCLPSGTQIALHLSGLIPNAIYRLWVITFEEPGFDIGPPPDMTHVIGEGALGPNDRSHNTFTASATGEAHLTRIHPPGPLSETLPAPPYANEPAGACLLTDVFEWHVVGAFQQPDQPYGPEVGPPVLFPESAVEQFVFIFKQ